VSSSHYITYQLFEMFFHLLSTTNINIARKVAVKCKPLHMLASVSRHSKILTLGSVSTVLVVEEGEKLTVNFEAVVWQ